MNQKQTDITTGKQIRHLRTQSGMTQEELAGELNVTRQALSNWERDVNEPDLNTLKKICFLFGVHMDDFAKEVITKMETCEKKEKRQFNKYDMAIGLFYGVGIFLGIGIFFVGGFMTMSGAGWGASLFGGGCFSLVFGLICHAVITLRRNDDGNVNFQRENSAGAARYHSDWCSMMYSRLLLARNLLSEDGAIFISIDDNEYENLRKICNEVFGNENYLTTFHIQVRYGEKSLNEEKIFKPMIEYIVAYAKNQSSYVPNQPSEEYGLEKFIFSINENESGEVFYVNDQKVEVFKPGQWSIDKAEKGKLGLLKETWISGSIYTNMSYGKVFQKVVEPRIDEDGLGCLYKVYGRGEDGLGYRYYTGPARAGSTRGKMYSGVPTERAIAIQNGEGSLRKKPIQCFYDFSPDFGNIRHEGGVTFNSGKKPVKMMKQFINYSPKKDALILDFFSGSASTAEGVLQLNAEDGGTRKFIMVQIPEITDEKSDAYKAGFKTICELGEQRIKNVCAKMKDEQGILATQCNVGFRVLQLDESNMNDVYYAAGDYSQGMLSMLESNVKSDRTDLDLLFGCLLEWGLPLSMPYTSEQIEGCTVHTYNEGDLIACFDENIPDSVIKEIAKRQPLRAVFRDSSFANSPSKINVGEIFKLMAPDTRVKVI